MNDVRYELGEVKVSAEKLNEIGTMIVESAIAIHRELGPGLLESVYEIVLGYELRQRGLKVERQVSVPIEYKGLRFDEGYWIDLIVEGAVIIEIKSVQTVTLVHRKQLQTYLRLKDLRLGYLLNFGEALMKSGIHRIANKFNE